MANHPRFGFGINPSSTAEVLAAVREAEALGFDRVGIWDSPALHREPWVMLGAAAGASARVRLGPWVTNPLTRHPVVTASAIATLDDLAPGRAILAIGSGDSGVYSLGQRAAPLAHLEAYVRTVRRLLEDGAADWDGKRVTLSWAQRHVPIWMAAHGERSLRLAARIADGVIVGLGVSTEVVTGCLEVLDAAAVESGRSQADLEVWFTAPWYVDPEPAAARRDAAWHVASLAHHVARHGVAGKFVPPELADGIVRLGRSYDLSTHGAPPVDQKDAYARLARELGILDALLDRFAFAGTPAEVEAQVRRAIAAGAQNFDGANDAAPGSVMDRPRAWARHVLPRFAGDQPALVGTATEGPA
jgi:5,10-methylenetetrahydromethanopterin reductase